MLKLDLRDYGLSERFEREATLHHNLSIARVSEQHRGAYKVISANGEVSARVSGQFVHVTDDPIDYPTVGDWVMIEQADHGSDSTIIRNVLTRKSILARQSAGTSGSGQAIAANIDTVFICMSVNDDFNLRRLERYLAIAWDSRATPVIVLTKSDLSDNLQERLNDVSTVALGVDVIVCTSEGEGGYDAVRDYIGRDKSLVFIGSSGVGKSTLINNLAGQDVMTTREIRSGDDKGRHATTHRQLLLLPQGGIVIDTPGMRELQMRDGNISKTFEDIEDIASQCKFRNCSHESEVGCAIRKAIDVGALPEERFDSYLKLQREIVYSGLSSRQVENEKIHSWFKSKNEMKQFKRNLKKR